MVLIVVISVMTGFDRELQRVILGFEPHITVGNGQLLEDWRETCAEDRAHAGGRRGGALRAGAGARGVPGARLIRP